MSHLVVHCTRRSVVSCSLARRAFHASVLARRDSDPLPRPPRPIEDSTSALEYKSSQKRRRPPPLPATDLRSRSVEETVTNILYNTPPPSLQPFKRHVLNCLVQNEPGVLSRVSGTLAGRGFNIDSLVVCSTEVGDLSRMCIVLSGQDGVVEQARRQLEDLVPVWAVLDYTDTRTISRELLLAKVSILGPEYLEDQLIGGHTYDPRSASTQESQTFGNTDEHTLLDDEVALAQAFEHSGEPESLRAETETIALAPLTPTQALLNKHQILQSISSLSSQFGAKIVDVSTNSVIVEMTGKTARVDAFLALLKPFGVLESARTGLMVMPRTPLQGAEQQVDPASETDTPDASMLPPG